MKNDARSLVCVALAFAVISLGMHLTLLFMFL